MKRLLVASVAITMYLGYGYAQDDGRIVFKDPKGRETRTITDEDKVARPNAWGTDLMIGNDGFGLGFFYHRLFSEVITGTAMFNFSEIKDERQRDRIDIYGNSFSPNKINRVFRIPLFVGVQYRLFEDDILENFRPYVSGGMGPVILYVTSAAREFFSSLGHGAASYTFGGYAGFGAHFGFDRTSILGINVRYYLIPVPSGIQSVEEGDLINGDGFFISLNFGFAF